jgi:hypothetical protein
MPRSDAQRSGKGFLRGESGAATVEAALWIPFFVLLVALFADASFLFNRQAQMLRTVQDVNRAFAVGQFASPEQVQDRLTELYQPYSDQIQVESVYDTTRPGGGLIRTSLSIPARDVVSIGIIASLTDFDLTVVSEQYREF